MNRTRSWARSGCFVAGQIVPVAQELVGMGTKQVASDQLKLSEVQRACGAKNQSWHL